MRRLLLVALLLAVAAAAAAYFFFVRPRLQFTNQLAAPVRLSYGDGPARILAPGETVELPVSSGGATVAEWAVERPLSADGQPMGEEIRGAVVTRGPGLMVDSAWIRQGDADYFAPLVTNATGGPLRITVNAGLQGARDCGCAVRPGVTRVFLGYYRLYGNSTVRARSTAGRTATFRDLGPQVRSADGTLGLRFEEKDFRGAER